MQSGPPGIAVKLGLVRGDFSFVAGGTSLGDTVRSKGENVTCIGDGHNKAHCFVG